MVSHRSFRHSRRSGYWDNITSVLIGIDIILGVIFIVFGLKSDEFLGYGSTNYSAVAELILVFLTGLLFATGVLFVLITRIARPVTVDIDGSALRGAIHKWMGRLVFGGICVALLYYSLYQIVSRLAALAAKGHISLSVSFYLYLGSFTIFTAGAVLLYRNMKRTSEKKGQDFRSGQPTYTLKDDGIIIDLKKPKFGIAGQKYEVPLKFDEIDSITPMSFQDANNYYWSRHSEIVDAKARCDDDMAGYVNGKLEKPQYYVSSLGRREHEFSGAIALIRGPSLFYFIVLDADSITDLVSSFNAYKDKNALKICTGE